MQREYRRAKNKRLSRRMQRKLTLVFGVICILFVILCGRVMYISNTSGAKYERIVLAQQKYDSTIIPFKRGNISDSKGTVLATSVDVYNVILDCYVLNDREDKKDGSAVSTAEAVAKCFPDVSKDDVLNALRTNPESRYTILKKRASYEQMAAYKELAAEKDSLLGGVWFEKEYIRQYPYGSLAASTLGYATSGNIGVIGLETYYNNTLNGTNGRTYGYQNSDSNLEITTIEPENGGNISLSLDVNIQTICENAIKDFNKTYETETQLGSKHTAALVMNPKDGSILAMAQYPSFDLNNPRDLSRYYSSEQLADMSEEDKLDQLNKIWQNFFVTYTYEPGSTFKPFTLVSGLESGTLKGDEGYYCDGAEEVGGHLIHCVKVVGHGYETVSDSLSNSCNDAFMQMSYKIGPKNFAATQSAFGFGQKTYIDLPGEASTAGLIYKEEQLSPVNLAVNSFGQSFNTTMIQLASATCSLINGGNLYQPHIVSKITDSNGNTIKEVEPVVLKKTVSDDVAAMVKQYMFEVVSRGSGKTAGVKGYEIGGKTGTAEKLPRGNHKYLVSFIGFAPVEDPQVLVYVIVDEANSGEQFHSYYAQGIAHDIFKQILPYLGIEATDDAENLNETLLQEEIKKYQDAHATEVEAEPNLNVPTTENGTTDAGSQNNTNNAGSEPVVNQAPALN